MDEFEKMKIIPRNVVGKKCMCENLTFKSNFFDVLFCRNVLDHTFSPEKSMKEMKRVLNKNGHLFLSCDVYSPSFAIYRKFKEFLGIGDVYHPHSFTKNSLISLVKKYFKILEVYELSENKRNENLKSVIFNLISYFEKIIIGFSYMKKEIIIFAEK